jgi:hypothetical protein
MIPQTFTCRAGIPTLASTLDFELVNYSLMPRGNLWPKKMSGRWGDRPLGRGGWRVLQPEASPVLPMVLLRSRAAEHFTGANRPKPFYSGSRNQLPITVTILRSTLRRVDSPPGSFFSVLPATLERLFLVPMYLRKFFAPLFESCVHHCVLTHSDSNR